MQPARNDMKDLFGDLDKDGIPNMLDCEPHDSTKDGYLGDRWYNFRERVSAIPRQVSKYVPRQVSKYVPREIIESKIKRQVSVPLKGREAWKWKPPAISETQEPSALETQESITGKYLLHPLVIKPSIAGIEWYGKRIGEPFRESITESTEKALETIEQHEKESIKQEPFGRTVVPPGFLPPPISKRLIPITKDVAAGVVEVPPALLGLFGVLGPTVTEMAIREPTVLPGYAAYQAKEMGKYAIEHPVEFTTTMAMMGPVIKGIPKPKYLVGGGYKGLGIKDKPLIGVERGKLKLGEVKIEVARTRPIEAIEYDVIRKVEVDAIKKIQKEMLLTEEGLKISPEIKARSHVKLITETVPERSIPRVERLKYEQEAGRMVLPIEFERFITEPIGKIGKVTQEIGTGLLLLRKERASVGQKIYDQSTLVGESIKTDVKTWVSETSELGKPLKGSEKWVHELIDVDSIKVERPIERGEPVLGKEGVYALEEPRVITETIKGEVESIKGSTKRISDIKTKKGKKQLSLKEIEDVLWEDLLREEKAQLTSGKTISKSFDEITKEIVEDIKIETVKSDIAPMKDVVKTTDKAVSKTKKATTQVHGQPQMTVSRLDEAIQKSVPQRILSKRKIIEDETYYVSERAPMAIRDISMPTIPVQISDVKSMSITMPQVQSVQVPEMKTIQKDIQRELEKTALVEDIVQIERVTPIQKERILEISKQKPIQIERIRVKPIVPLIKIPKSWEKPPVVAKKKKKDKKVFSFLHDDLEDIYRTRKYAMLTSEEMLKL